MTFHEQSQALSRTRVVTDAVAEYDKKYAEAEFACAAFKSACAAMAAASTVGGVSRHSVASYPTINERDLKLNLLLSAWRSVYELLRIDDIAPLSDRKRFDRELEKPPEFTFDNIRANFGTYLWEPRFHILKGLAEVFSGLNPVFKSHDRARIGVKGLPKRVILEYFTSYHSTGLGRFRDLANALAVVQRIPKLEGHEIEAMERAHRNGEDAEFYGSTRTGHKGEQIVTPNRGLMVRRFTDTAHIYFTPGALYDINAALAEFYGEVLPDTPDENAKRSTSTAVAKDLQFYATPTKIVKEVLDLAYIIAPDPYYPERFKPFEVLEPSCGDGRFLDEIKKRGHHGFGVEVEPGRVAASRAKGHPVHFGNFLETTPTPTYDRVVMNPPFYGRHYVKHVRHALKFLKPDGVLVAILPASARYEHKELSGRWQDLPTASFAESGTNIHTTILTMFAP